MMQRGKTLKYQHGHGYFFIPQELVADILSRLPTAASVVRFRCVSKSWNRLLSHPKSIHRALFHTQEEEEAPMVLLKRRVATRSLYSVLSYHTLLPITMSNDDGLWQDRNIPFNSGDHDIIGCCNGVFCIRHRILTSENTFKVFLWNPSTSETKLLPYPPDIGIMVTGFAFGFDSGDYKLVQITRRVWGGKDLQVVSVYSLRNDWWRDIIAHEFDGRHPLPYRFPLWEAVRTHKSSCEVAYWYDFLTSSHRDRKYIASFDFGEEKMSTQVFPAELVARVDERRGFSMVAASSKDSLVVVFCGLSSNKFEVWGLLSFRNVESWTKLFTSNVGHILGPIHIFPATVRFSGNGEYVFVKTSGELFGFNLATQEASEVDGIQVVECGDGVETYTYIPSIRPLP